MRNMNLSVKNALILGVAAMALAACGKKAPPELPPQPVQQPTQPSAPPPQYNQNPVSNTPVPGSQADFLSVVISDRIYFDTDEYNVDGQDQSVLQSQAEWLRRYPNKQIVIEGHTDERGTRDYNLALGERRANATKNYLVSLGVDASRIRVISYGKERPQSLGSDATSWGQNRRAVTVTID